MSIFVCVLNLVMVTVSLFFFYESKILKGFLVLISLCTYIMIVSSAYRMFMYIEIYQMTRLRLVVFWPLVVWVSGISIFYVGLRVNVRSEMLFTGRLC